MVTKRPNDLPSRVDQTTLLCASKMADNGTFLESVGTSRLLEIDAQDVYRGVSQRIETGIVDFATISTSALGGAGRCWEVLGAVGTIRLLEIDAQEVYRVVE